MIENAAAPDIGGDEDDIDGCDVEFHDSDATPDEDLPVAIGGVKIAGEGDDIDGCDVHIDDLDATPDEKLPAAKGGVA